MTISNVYEFLDRSKMHMCKLSLDTISKLNELTPPFGKGAHYFLELRGEESSNKGAQNLSEFRNTTSLLSHPIQI